MSTTLLQQIQTQLRQVETEHAVRVLYACESGSRAWGFPSPNSDYDIRFIYLRSLHDYLRIEEMPLQLSFPLEGEFDLHGWDLRKVLQLMQKSNSTPHEWLRSPIIYHQKQTVATELWRLSQQYCCPRTIAFHYLGMAKGALNTLEQQQIKIKKLFYVLRPLLAAQWMLSKKQIPPMEMQPLLALLPAALQQQVQQWIEKKAKLAESHLIRLDATLLDYIHSQWARSQEQANELEKENFAFTALNDYFVALLQCTL